MAGVSASSAVLHMWTIKLGVVLVYMSVHMKLHTGNFENSIHTINCSLHPAAEINCLPAEL